MAKRLRLSQRFRRLRPVRGAKRGAQCAGVAKRVCVFFDQAVLVVASGAVVPGSEHDQVRHCPDACCTKGCGGVAFDLAAVRDPDAGPRKTSRSRLRSVWRRADLLQTGRSAASAAGHFLSSKLPKNRYASARFEGAVVIARGPVEGGLSSGSDGRPLSPQYVKNDARFDVLGLHVHWILHIGAGIASHGWPLLLW